MMHMTRRDLLMAAGVTPLVAMQHTQRLPLMALPVDAPSGLGVGAPWQSHDDIPDMLERLRPAWWYDWRFEQAGSAGYVPMIWSDGIWADHAPVLESLFARRNDLFWLLWNEPERSDQANMTPEATAALTWAMAEYGICYAAPGVSLTRGGYEWLDAYMAAGAPVPHCWHVHVYWCLEPQQWDDAWAKWLDWMRVNDCVRPTIVSETNAWTEGTYGQQRMVEHVAGKLDAEPLLKAVAWFATRYNEGTVHPHLLGEAGDLTSVGRTFAEVRRGR